MYVSCLKWKASFEFVLKSLNTRINKTTIDEIHCKRNREKYEILQANFPIYYFFWWDIWNEKMFQLFFPGGSRFWRTFQRQNMPWNSPLFAVTFPIFNCTLCSGFQSDIKTYQRVRHITFKKHDKIQDPVEYLLLKKVR